MASQCSSTPTSPVHAYQKSKVLLFKQDSMQPAPSRYGCQHFKVLKVGRQIGYVSILFSTYSILSRSIWNKILLFFQLHILIQVINKNSKWPGQRIGPKVILFHLAVPSGSLQPVLAPFKCTTIHPIHISLCLVKCIAKAQLYCLWHLMSNQPGRKKMSQILLIYSVAPSDHHLSIRQCPAQHRPTHRRHSINICGIESLQISFKYGISLSLIHIREIEKIYHVPDIYIHAF